MKNQKETTFVLIDVAISADRNVTQNVSRKGSTIEEFKYRDTTYVYHEIPDYTDNNWSYRNLNIRFKEKFWKPEEEIVH
jgi:hypothetical protein